MSTILALDTTSAHCAVAVLCDGKVKASITEPMTKGQAERLFPIIENALAQVGLTYTDLNAIAVATGPGNFTGVRICVSAARGLALSLGIPAVGVSVLEALAYGTKGEVIATVDARGGMIYSQTFRDGVATVDAQHHTPDDIRGKTLGFLANAEMPMPETYGLIAMTRDWTDAPRPAPLYLRAADAALPSEPAPHLIP